MPRLENWSVTAGHLVGEVYGHEKMSDGERVVTTALQGIDFVGKRAQTKSGTVYELGEPAVSEPTVYAARSEQ